MSINDRLRHMPIDSARVSKADGSQSLEVPAERGAVLSRGLGTRVASAPGVREPSRRPGSSVCSGAQAWMQHSAGTCPNSWRDGFARDCPLRQYPSPSAELFPGLSSRYMAFVTWLRALNAVGTVAEATRLFRGTGQSADQPPAPSESAGGSLETRLANVVVAALREAFDRDRARFDLERDLHTAEATRRAEALRLEWLRHTGTQALTQTRYLAVLSVVVWVASVIAAGWLSPLGAVAKSLLGVGWVGLSTAIATAFITHQHLATWLARAAIVEDGAPTPTRPSSIPTAIPQFSAQRVLPWLFLAGFLMTAAGLVVDL